MDTCRKKILMTILELILLTGTGPARADETNTSYLVVGGGVMGVLDDTKSIIGMIELQPKFRAGPFATWIGFQASDQEYFLGGGVLLDWYVTDRLFITPSFGAGAYGEHHGINLGSVLEFRSGIECGYDFKDAGRISIGFWHFSNAGFGDTNPGTEVVALRYSLPIGKN